MSHNISGSATPAGSNFARPGQPRMGATAEPSNLQELSQSILQTPNMMSNFQKKRGFMDVNRLLKAPTFNSQNLLNQGANNQMSSTGMMGAGGLPAEQSISQVLYGTNINPSDVQQKLKNFINTFVELNEDADDDEGDDQFTKKPFYWERLQELRELEESVLEVNCDHLFQYDQSLYKQIEEHPIEVIPIFDLVASAVYKEIAISAGGMGMGNQMDIEDHEADCLIQVRPFNLRRIYRIREMGPEHIERLITLRGIVIRCSDIVPEMKEASFTCTNCSQEERVLLDKGRIAEPSKCKNCKESNRFKLVHNNCMFSDKQHVKVQETPESVPEGETPQTIHLCSYDDMIDEVRPGDRVEITGIFKAMGIRVNPNQRKLKNVYRTYVDVITYLKTDKNRVNMKDKDQEKNEQNVEMADDEEEENHAVADQGLQQEHSAFTDKEIREFREFAKTTDLYDQLIDSLAPSIWENQDVKKGILTQLFGGVSKELGSTGRGRFRGEINILLCGDPSTAKSQLLQYVHKIAPRGIYTSGKGSSAVGLTVYITKDPETKEIVLESGALVLSDRGICCIDEFDKMDENTRNILHEAMEQQTVSVAKAGIICTLNARTAILAAANPVQSKYNPKLSIVDNIRLPPTLLSRFDLIYLVLDKQSEQSDRRLANHIVSLYSLPSEADIANINVSEAASNLIATNKRPRDFLARYISYARKHCQPVITDEAAQTLVNEYQKMRSLGNSKKTITATPRQLESMIRIAESVSKMRLSQEVKQGDVEEAVRLIKTAIQQSATDPKTGEIDMDILTTGVSTASASRIKKICEFIRSVETNFREKVAASGVKYLNLFEYINSKAQAGMIGGETTTITESEFRESLIVLEGEEVITLLGHRTAPTIRFNAV